MPRPLRLEYPDALYHVTARGTRQGAIFLDDQDRASLLSILARALKECDARAFAYCLMGNHYHFVLQTRQANLSVLMRRVNSVYSLTSNNRHGGCGHVFEGDTRPCMWIGMPTSSRCADTSTSIRSGRAWS